MGQDDVKFETREAQVVKGFEEKTRTKWESQGWEFVHEEKGKIRTKLTFRRPKPKVSRPLIAVLSVLFASLIGFSLFMSSIEGGTPETAPDSAASTVSDSSTPDAPASVAPEILTADNNLELAELLSSSGEDVEMNRAFFDKYSDVLIEFDANIANLAKHGDYETRFDVLILPGDFSGTNVIGPPFRSLDVSYSDFGVIGPDAPDAITQGLNVRIVGKVLDWDDQSMTFTLEIVSTEVR